MKTTLIDVNEIDKHAADGVNKLLVGNRCEPPSKEVVSTGETKELADSLNIRFLEASAKNGHNVEEAFNICQGEQAGKQGSRADCGNDPSQRGYFSSFCADTKEKRHRLESALDLEKVWKPGGVNPNVGTLDDCKSERIAQRNPFAWTCQAGRAARSSGTT